MEVGVIGLGYVGLPLAVAFAEAGHEVVCFDLDAAKIEALRAGRSYIGDVGDEVLAPLPFGFMRFDPGPGMGGHCLPVDPFYLAFKAREHDFSPEFIELAGKVNQAQPGYCVERIERALNEDGKPVKGSRILILGVSYKGGIGDIRESPALKIIGRLQDMGAAVSYHDAFVPELPGHGLASVELEAGLAAADVAAIVTAHPGIDYAELVTAAARVIDFRNVTRGIERDNLTRL